MFGKSDKKKTVEINGQQIELQPKPSVASKLFGGAKKPAAPPATPQAPPPPKPAPQAPPPKPKTSIFTPAPLRPQQAAPPQPSSMSPTQQPPVAPNKPYTFQFPTQAAQPKQPQPPPQPAKQIPTTPVTPAPSLQPTFAPPTLTKPFTKPVASLQPVAPTRPPRQGPPNKIRLYIQKLIAKRPDLEASMRKEGMKEPVYDFVKRMLIVSIIFSAIIAIGVGVVFYILLHNPATAGLLAVMIGIAAYMAVSKSFLNYPMTKGRSSSKKVERDILFAARDLIIALRSGMPLFNAITSVSSGYGEASKEFLKIVEKVQLGTPLEDAIDQVVSSTKSQSFRKIMLQASVSIKVGADVISALQSIIDQLATERVIELRRYGQRLNAIAMFYMLFGIILPSMGIAVLTILTTFIPIFTVNSTLLEMVIVGIIFLQVVFLQLIRSSRPIFSM